MEGLAKHAHLSVPDFCVQANGNASGPGQADAFQQLSLCRSYDLTIRRDSTKEEHHAAT